MGQYEKDKKELVEKIEQLEHKLKKAKQAGDKNDVDKYSRKLAEGARETFLRGRKGRAAKNSVVTSGVKQLKC